VPMLALGHRFRLLCSRKKFTCLINAASSTGQVKRWVAPNISTHLRSNLRPISDVPLHAVSFETPR